MNFWQLFRRANVNPSRGWRQQRAAVGKQKSRYYFTLPIFNVSTPVWIGSSYITTEFRLTGLVNRFSLQPRYLIPPENADFCLAVRSPANNDTGLDVIRYKLWEDVGERLNYPLYNGELLSPDSVFEIWSSADASQTSLIEPFILPISYLASPSNNAECCSTENLALNSLAEFCELFASGIIEGSEVDEEEVVEIVPIDSPEIQGLTERRSEYAIDNVVYLNHEITQEQIDFWIELMKNEWTIEAGLPDVWISRTLFWADVPFPNNYPDFIEKFNSGNPVPFLDDVSTVAMSGAWFLFWAYELYPEGEEPPVDEDVVITDSYVLPMVFGECFDAVQPPGETFYRVTEFDEIRANELDDLRVYI